MQEDAVQPRDRDTRRPSPSSPPWISAETGVGRPSASGSQTCSGSVPTFPVAPMNRNTRQAGRDRDGTGEERGIDLVHLQRAERAIEQEHAIRKPAVANAVGDERLLAGGSLLRVLEPEADQQVGRKPDAFPADEQLQQRATPSTSISMKNRTG